MEQAIIFHEPDATEFKVRRTAEGDYLIWWRDSDGDWHDLEDMAVRAKIIARIERMHIYDDWRH